MARIPRVVPSGIPYRSKQPSAAAHVAREDDARVTVGSQLARVGKGSHLSATASILPPD
jgi:hypothetical protein